MSHANAPRITLQAPEPSFEAVCNATDAKKNGNHWMGTCPCHDDGKRSLSISRGKKVPVIVKCHAGCDTRDIHEALKARGAPVFPEKPLPVSKKPRNKKPRQLAAQYIYTDEQGKPVSRVLRLEPKDFRQNKYEAGQYHPTMKGARIVPYNLVAVAEAIANEQTVFIVEGEKDVEKLAGLGIVASCNAGGAGNFTTAHAEHFKGADVFLIPDNDGPGRKHMQGVEALLQGIAARVGWIELPGLPDKGDVSDWIDQGGTAEELWRLVDEPEVARRREDDRKLKLLERRASDTGPVLELIEKAKQSAPPPSPVAREIVRNSCTKPEAATRADKKAKPNRRAHWVNVAADEEQDTAALIAALEALFSRHIVLPENGAFVCALWTLHTWVFDAFASSPFLLIESPTKQCGKTTLLTLLSWLTRRAMLSSNISAAALYRYIETHEPTLIVDEADTFMRENEALRGILNSGHTRAGAYVVRCVGEGTAQEPADFSTWCPKAVASIGTMKDTIKDRGIRLTLTRRTRDQQIARRPMADTPEFAEVRSRLMRWAEDNEARLRAYQVQLPDELFNRLGDNWEPLLAIAGIAGDDIRKRAETAAVSIAEAAEEGDRKVDLLEDIRRVFDNAGLDEITAETLVVHLCDLPETPWEVWRPGDKPITSRGVSTMLKGFGLKSHHESHARVWRKTDFAKAWKAYLAPGGRE